jgi:hypothetical protein
MALSPFVPPLAPTDLVSVERVIVGYHDNESHPSPPPALCRWNA